jgi:hypothetical protein
VGSLLSTGTSSVAPIVIEETLKLQFSQRKATMTNPMSWWEIETTTRNLNGDNTDHGEYIGIDFSTTTATIVTNVNMSYNTSLYGEYKDPSSTLVDLMWEWMQQADATSLTVCVYAGRHQNKCLKTKAQT